MQPRWAPDGHELFYVGPDGMMAVAVDTEPTFSFDQPELLFDTAGYVTPMNNVRLNRRIDISPDGTRFLMFKLGVTADDAPDLILVQNWHEELKRLVPVN